MLVKSQRVKQNEARFRFSVVKGKSFFSKKILYSWQSKISAKEAKIFSCFKTLESRFGNGLLRKKETIRVNVNTFSCLL